LNTQSNLMEGINMSIFDKMNEKRAGLLKAAHDLAETAIAEERELSADEQTGFEQRIAEIAKLDERKAQFAEIDQRDRDIEESFRKAGVELPSREERKPHGDASLGKWAREARNGEGFDTGLRGMSVAETRAMSGTGGLGKQGVAAKLWEYAVAQSSILSAGAEVINTADGNTIPLPVVTAHAATSDTPAAASAALTSSDATVTTVDLTVSKYNYYTLVPSELFADATWDLEGYLARAAGRELGRRIQKQASAAAVTGFSTVGSTGPTGTSLTLGAQATAGMGSDLLVDLFHSVLPEYRAMGGAWIMSDTTAAIVQKLKSSQGVPIWQDSIQIGQPDMILGRAAYADTFLPAPAANAKTIYFGDFSALKVRIAGGLRFERSNEYAFANDQVAFRAIVRTGAVVVDANAVKAFAHSAT
jgi:HK97 family phage major capsid protein